MKARTFKSIEGDVYKVSIYTEDWSENDIGQMMRFGEPEIDLGGTFTSGPLSFTLPTQLVRIRAESPFTVGFDVRDEDDAEERANLWTTTILARLEAAITTLRGQTDDFTSESVVTI